MYLVFKCLFIELIIILMSEYNCDEKEYNLWETSRFKDIPEGKYYIYKNTLNYCFISRDIESDKHYIVWFKNDLIEKTASSCGGEYIHITYHPGEYRHYDWYYEINVDVLYYKNVYLTCKVNNECREVFIHGSKNSILIYKLYYILNLKPNTKYFISNFTKSDYKSRDTITARQIYHNEIKKYYINKKIMDILEKYFMCEEDKIYCIYNNKKVVAKLTLITKDVMETDDQTLQQSLKLEIENNKFTFYINDSKNINYTKTGKYCFLAMHLYNNLIYGYEYKEDKYYYLRYEEELILKNIDKEIAKNFKEIKGQDLYTYLLSNNEKRGMTISIDKDKNITYRLLNLNDDFFKSKSIKTLDISLLKPQIIIEDCENK